MKKKEKNKKEKENLYRIEIRHTQNNITKEGGGELRVLQPADKSLQATRCAQFKNTTVEEQKLLVAE